MTILVVNQHTLSEWLNSDYSVLVCVTLFNSVGKFFLF